MMISTLEMSRVEVNYECFASSDGNTIRFTSTRPQPSRLIMHKEKEMERAREGTQYVNVETQMWEKTRQPSDCRMIPMREENNNGESTEFNLYH